MFNRYAYAFNDPVNMIDPDGEQGVGVKFEGSASLLGFMGVEGGVTFSGANEGGRLPGGFDVGIKGHLSFVITSPGVSGEAAVEMFDGSIADSTAPSIELNLNGNGIPTPVGLVGPSADIGINGTNNGDPALNNGMLDVMADNAGRPELDVSNASVGISTATSPTATVSLFGVQGAVSTSGAHLNGETKKEFGTEENR